MFKLGLYYFEGLNRLSALVSIRTEYRVCVMPTSWL